MTISQAQIIMKSNELMIGNYVRETASNFMMQNKKVLTVESIYTKHLIASDGNLLSAYTEKRFEGIPITEEMLERLGFERNPNSEYFEDDKHYFHPDLKPPYLLTSNFSVFESITLTTYKKDWILAKFSYVHELQNWWFSIFKTQLKCLARHYGSHRKEHLRCAGKV